MSSAQSPPHPRDRLDDTAGWVAPSAYISPASGPASPADVLPGRYAAPAAPVGSGTTFAFSGADGGGLGWARRPRRTPGRPS